VRYFRAIFQGGALDYKRVTSVVIVWCLALPLHGQDRPIPDRLEKLRKQETTSDEREHRSDSYLKDYVKLVWRDPMFYGALGASGIGAWGIRRLTRAHVDALNDKITHLKSARAHVAHATKEFYDADRELKKAFGAFQKQQASIQELNLKVEKLKTAYDKWQTSVANEIDHLPKGHGLSIPKGLAQLEKEVGSIDSIIDKAPKENPILSRRKLSRSEIKEHNQALSKVVKRSVFDSETQLLKRGIAVPGRTLSRWRHLKRPELIILVYPFVDFGLWNYRMALERREKRAEAYSQARLENREEFVQTLVLSFQRPLLWTLVSLWRKDPELKSFPCPIAPALFEEDNVHLQTMAEILEGAIAELTAKKENVVESSGKAGLKINQGFYEIIVRELMRNSPNRDLRRKLEDGELNHIIKRIAREALHFYESTNEWVDQLILSFGPMTLKTLSQEWKSDVNLMLYPFPLGLTEEEESLPPAEKEKVMNKKSAKMGELMSEALAELYEKGLYFEEEKKEGGLPQGTNVVLRRFYELLLEKICVLEPSLKELANNPGTNLLTPIISRFIDSLLAGKTNAEGSESDNETFDEYFLREIQQSPDPVSKR